MAIAFLHLGILLRAELRRIPGAGQEPKGWLKAMSLFVPKSIISHRLRLDTDDISGKN